MFTASSSVLKLVIAIHRIGKKMMKPTSQQATVVTVLRWTECARAISQASRLRPIIRTRKKATMLARTTATMPPADAPPTSNCSSAWA